MIQNFSVDLSNKQLGIADDAGNIKDIALDNAAKQSGVQDTQLDIQQKQLANQDVQLKYQQDLQQIQQDFKGDQQAIQQKADQLYQQYQQTYPAAMQQFAADAANYDTPERRAQAGAEATAGVGMQFQAARDAATRQLESFGIKPSDTRFAALDLGTRIKEAAQKAASDRAAQLATEQQGFNLRAQAIQQGSVLPGQSTAETGAANTAGSLVNSAGQVASGQGTVANQAGSVANAAGANAIGAGNATTSAINSATGALNTQVGATQGATQAETGALGANTAGAVETGAAGDLINKTYATGAAAMGSPDSYLNTGLQGTLGAGTTEAQAYDNQIKQFKAEQSNTSGLGA